LTINGNRVFWTIPILVRGRLEELGGRIEDETIDNATDGSVFLSEFRKDSFCYLATFFDILAD